MTVNSILQSSFVVAIKLFDFYIIMMEFMSIMENIDKMGVPLPRFISEVINNKDDSISEEQYVDMANRLKKAMDLIDELEHKGE